MLFDDRLLQCVDQSVEKARGWRYPDDESNAISLPTTPPIPAKTTWTLLIYLTGPANGCVGGETVFYPELGPAREFSGKSSDGTEPVVVGLEVGMALLHKHGQDCLLHEGREVMAGEKWVIRSDLCVKRWLERINSMCTPKDCTNLETGSFNRSFKTHDIEYPRIQKPTDIPPDSTCGSFIREATDIAIGCSKCKTYENLDQRPLYSPICGTYIKKQYYCLVCKKESIILASWWDYVHYRIAYG